MCLRVIFVNQKTSDEMVISDWSSDVCSSDLADMVDVALGMGYGVISTTLLLSGVVNPVVVSGSIHTAEMFSSGASGYSHYKCGNVNKKLFKTLLIPGDRKSVV